MAEIVPRARLQFSIDRQQTRFSCGQQKILPTRKTLCDAHVLYVCAPSYKVTTRELREQSKKWQLLESKLLMLKNAHIEM